MSLSSSSFRPSSFPPPSPTKQGWTDIKNGLALWKLAFSLGWLDIKLRYRGSALGPLWLTLTTASMVISMGFIYSHLFRLNLHDYLPFLAISLILWQTGIACMISEACTCFTEAEHTIRSIKLPFFVQALRTVWRNIIVFLHNIIVPLAVFAYVGVWPGLNALYCLPAFFLWTLDGLALCLFLGCICSRFRDIPPIVNTLLQLAFYVTPIIWTPTQLGSKGWWLPFNPFFSLLEIVRGPLLSTQPKWDIWLSALLFSLLLWVMAWMTFKISRARLIFWL
ncbi:ABC transporter permease [Entomobacter blattae]|uniref:ABC-2 type transporter n=1 Tax=Entomobacter blattae TaxID=2762277 RepID=A0A7H1NQM8_9PROT|nr:ABC transporter permease [Entomobacter blattae]QNT78088.1 ABC-2 type transporter [Entomobacter blattae]